MTPDDRTLLFHAGLALALLGALAAPRAARAQLGVELTAPTAAARTSSAPDPARVAAMASELERRSGGERTSRTINGIIGLGTAAALIGGSIWLAVDVEAFGGFGGPSPILVTGLAVAPMLIAWGVSSLAGIGHNEDRLLRWRRAMDGGLDALELARFEGELRAEASASRVARWGSLALGVGVLAGGAVAMILGGALDGFDDTLRGITIGGGGGLVALGAVMIGTSFIASSVEQMWDRYRAGGGPPAAAAVTLRPVVGPGAVGLVGTF